MMVAHFFLRGVGGKKGDSQADRGSAQVVMVNVSSIFHLEFIVPVLLLVGILKFTKIDVQQVLTTGLCGL